MPTGVYKRSLAQLSHLRRLGKKQVGKKSYRWKGNRVGYHGLHKWLKYNFGKATRCENRNCVYPRKNAASKIVNKPKMFEWALLKGKRYGHKRENFIQLCSSCHRKYDGQKPSNTEIRL